MPSVLFVCTGNQVRSPIAAAFLMRLLVERGLSGWLVESAGTWTIPGQLPPSSAVHDAGILGLDIRGHTTRTVDQGMLASFDLILVMESGQKEALNIEFPEVRRRIHLLSDMLLGVPFDIPDPASLPGRQVRILQDMCDVIERGCSRIVELARLYARSRS